VDPETTKLLKENIALNKENNVLLHKLVRSHRMVMIYRFVYWIIIILTTLGAFYFIQPFLGNVFNTYGVSNQGNVDDIIKNLSNKEQIQSLFDSIKQ